MGKKFSLPLSGQFSVPGPQLRVIPAWSFSRCLQAAAPWWVPTVNVLPALTPYFPVGSLPDKGVTPWFTLRRENLATARHHSAKTQTSGDEGRS